MAKKHQVETRYIFPEYELKNKKTRFIYRLWGLFAVGGAVLATIPFIWMLITSVTPVKLIFAPVGEVFKNLSFNTEYYKQAWEITPFVAYFKNSMIVAVSVVAGQIFIS